MSRLNRQRPGHPHTARGFSLVEIMVAVVVICVGLLGIAKMQALAVSSTTTARLRAMAAFQAAGLASIMHSNRDYWASASAVANSPTTVVIPAGVGVAGIVVTPANFAQANNACIVTTVSAVPACPGTAGSTTLAGMDVTRWSQGMLGLLPNLTTTINCQGAIQPPSCIIQMQWTEQTGTVNSSETSVAVTSVAAGGLFDYYTLYVAP
jgi:type IV pilus assembly protein PilV